MDLRTTGSRDERRRRVLIDDAQAEPALGDENPPAKRSKTDGGKGTRYSPEALDLGQPRIADLLPKRRLTLWLWLLAATLLVSALVALDYASAGWSAQYPDVDWSVLRLDARGSLGSWIAALLLAWSGFAGLQIYLIRRHRADDYRGGYRLWSAAAVLLTMASADAATSLHAFLGQLLGSLSGAEEHSASIGIGLVSTAGVAFGLRIVFEIKPSRGALAALSAVACCYLASVLSAAGLMHALPVRPSLVGAAAAVAGHALVLLTVGVFGRYVFLEAHGQLKQRTRKKKSPTEELGAKKRSAKSKPSARDGTSDDSKKRGKTDVEGTSTSPEKRPEPAKKTPESKPSPAASTNLRIAGKSSAESDDEDDAEESPRLSKAERRRLRKQQFNRKAA